MNADSGFIYKTVKGTGDDRIVKQVTDTNLDIDSVPGDDPPQVGTFVIVKHNEPPYGFTTHYEVESIDGRTIYGKTTVSSLTDSVRYQVTSVDDGNIDFKVNSVELSGDRSYFLQGISLESFLEYVSKDAVKTDEKEERIETAFGIRDTTVYTYKIDLVDDGLEGSSAYKLWVGKNDVIYCVEYSYTVDYYDDEEDYLETDVGIEIYKLIGTNLFA